MRSLVCTMPGKLEYEDTPDPVKLPGSTIVQINRVGVCGTDLHAFEGTQPYFNYPRILGHELAATVVGSDRDSGFERGETVTVIPYFNCGKCVACRSGKPNCCEKLKVCGVHINGGMSEFLSVPDYSLMHSAGLTNESLCLVEPLSIGAHAIARAGVQPGDRVLVVGAGPIGLGIIEFARIAGGHVIALDVNGGRLEFCKNKLFVHDVIDASMEDVVEKLNDLTNGDMPEIVFDATGNLKAINHSFRYMAHGGKYILVGLQKESIQFSHPEFHKREGTLMSSRNSTRKDFEMVMRAIRTKQINPTAYITHRIKFDQAKKEFNRWLDPANGVVKAIIEFN